jgi:hypothetical protein
MTDDTRLTCSCGHSSLRHSEHASHISRDHRHDIDDGHGGFLASDDTRPLSADEERRHRVRHIPHHNEERALVCAWCRSPWPCLPARFLATLDAERARYAALVKAARRMDAALAFHNQTPTGRTRACLAGCVACQVREEYAALEGEPR